MCVHIYTHTVYSENTFICVCACGNMNICRYMFGFVRVFMCVDDDKCW